MATITTSDGTEIFYKDWGAGRPVVFSHGWPLTADAWDDQSFLIASNGYRAIAHDRRGGGRSGQPWNGNDLNTYADDLAELMEALNLYEGCLVGHSTLAAGGHAGTGRSWHRPRRQGGAARRHPATPTARPPPTPTACPPRRSTSPGGPDRSDRPRFYKDLSLPFYGANWAGNKISKGLRDSFWLVAMSVGVEGRRPLHQGILRDRPHRGPQENRSTRYLDVHGDYYQNVPIEASAMQSSKIVKDATLKVYHGAPHGLAQTTAYKDTFNNDLLNFIKT